MTIVGVAPVGIPCRPRRRRGLDDLPILIALAHFHAATVRTICYRFYVHAGRDPRSGLRNIRRLVLDGLVDSTPLMPYLGGASQRVLRLTDAGWSELGLRVPRRDAHRAAHDRVWRSYWCQRSHVLTARAVEGWTWCCAEESFERLRSAALLRLRGRALTELQRAFQIRIPKAPPQLMKLDALAHTGGGVRLLLPVRDGLRTSGLLKHLPPLALFGPIEFELVCAQPGDVSDARRDISRWWKSREAPPVVHALPSFVSVPNPAMLAATTIDLYASALGKDVRGLLRREAHTPQAPTPRVASRARGMWFCDEA
jgi:hypothetical protein